MSAESKVGPLDSRGPSTRRIKLLEEEASAQAIARLSQHDEGSRGWARAENRPFHARTTDA